jgi:BolA protein
VLEKICQKLQDNLQPDLLEVLDQSHLHAGHAGSRPEGETHFMIKIKSQTFSNMKTIECHRIIYDILSEEMKNSIHALAIKIIR